jgi:Transposase, Mutator family
MKTVPRNVHVVRQEHAGRVVELPEEVSLALAEIAVVAREGLLAMSVAAGMAVMQTMFEAEITAAAGQKGKHNPARTAVRHGTEKGSVTLGGRRVEVTRPRARTLDGHEVPLQAYSQFAADDLLSQVVLERMLAGVATRRHARIAEPIGEAVLEGASSTGRSAVSRRFIRETETALAELLARDVTLTPGPHPARPPPSPRLGTLAMPAHKTPAQPGQRRSPPRARRPYCRVGGWRGDVERTSRFQRPPVEPCMRFSRTRLTDVVHRRHSVSPAKPGRAWARQRFRSGRSAGVGPVTRTPPPTIRTPGIGDGVC